MKAACRLAARADNEVSNLPSLQRGARNFMSYCSGCHSLKYVRYSRVAEDLKISDSCATSPGEAGRQVLGLHQGVDAREGRARVVRQGAAGSFAGRAFARPDWIFNFLTTFYADPASRQTGVNNLQLPARRCRTCSRACRACRRRLEGRGTQG
jgi:ubiquinol-cytochrome c reductase cytochrome c1 subunit